jgi:hypothetical protein
MEAVGEEIDPQMDRSDEVGAILIGFCDDSISQAAL